VLFRKNKKKEKEMFQQLESLRDMKNLISRLPDQAINRIMQLQPIICLFELNVHAKKGGKAPLDYSVGATMYDWKFYYWKDIFSYGKELNEDWKSHPSLDIIKIRIESISKIYQDLNILLIHTCALFIQKVISTAWRPGPYNQQELIMNLIEKVINGDDPFQKFRQQGIFLNSNVYYLSALLGGTFPAINTFNDLNTEKKWDYELGEISFLIGPQFLKSVLDYLEPIYKQSLMEIIRNQIDTWRKYPPHYLNAPTKWDWLPKLSEPDYIRKF